VLRQRVGYRGPEAGEPVLEQIIRSPLLDHRDGEVLPDGAGDNQEGNIEMALVEQLERAGAAELRHLVVGEDDFRLELELGQVSLFGIDALPLRRIAAPPQLAQDELRIHRIVLGQQNTQGNRHIYASSFGG
jgi:hypothetical protein